MYRIIFIFIYIHSLRDLLVDLNLLPGHSGVGQGRRRLNLILRLWKLELQSDRVDKRVHLERRENLSIPHSEVYMS